MTNEEFIESIRLEGEEWRPVVGWEEYYMVSSYGRVATLQRAYVSSDGQHRITKNRIRKATVYNMGYTCYAMLTFNKDDHHYRMQVHRMVAMAFIPNPNNYPCVDHIDTNGLNNRVENLRWCTHKMNMHNPITFERYLKARQASKGKPLLKNAKALVQLDLEGNYIKTYQSFRDAESEGFFSNHTWNVCRGKKSQYKGYKWMYLSDYELLINKSKNPNEGEV